MTLILQNIRKLEEIKSLMELLPMDLYIHPTNVLSGSSIGQHLRHIIEFYTCFEKGINAGIISYDDRERNVLIESNMEYATKNIDSIIRFLSLIKGNKQLRLIANYSDTSDEQLNIRTSLNRELAYLLDHTVHHLAIVKIAVLHEDDKMELDASFGVASSTLRYCQQSRQ